MTPITNLLLITLLIAAARQDILTRLIPQLLPAAIACIVILARFPCGPRALLESFMTGGGVFVLLFVAYSRSVIGGGDVKLLTALSLGLPPLGTFHFIFATIMAGGLVGILYYAFGKIRFTPSLHGASALRRILAVECWRARRFRTVPYAVAIALGAAVVLLPPVLAPLGSHGN